ncbi:MAG: dTMP kinase [Desulfobulbus propionicus]|nr:MAG: dTMP kinase [Desulfobulbus propionicus]
MCGGLLIVFEGIDGTGKTTQLHSLAAYLKELGREVTITREPTDGPYGKKLREHFSRRHQLDPDEELALFINDRRQHVHELIMPDLRRGRIILTDRYYFSSAAYQGAAGGDPEAIFARHGFAPEPHLVLLLVLSPEEAVQRIRVSRGDRLNDFEQLTQLRRVAELYQRFTHPCIHRLDASAPFDHVQAAIRQAVQPLLEGGPR